MTKIAHVGGRTLMLTFSTYIDTIPLSATNAAGGTRVIGVGCRYYTTLRRGVFIGESVGRTNLAKHEATFAVKAAAQP